MSTIEIHRVFHARLDCLSLDMLVLLRGEVQRLHVLIDHRGQLSTAQVEGNIVAVALRLERILGDEGVRVEKVVRLLLSFNSGESEGK